MKSNTKRASYIAALGILVSAAAVYADDSGFKITTFRSSRPTPVATPVNPAPADSALNKFSPDRLLAGRPTLSQRQIDLLSQDWTTVATDTAAMAEFPKADRHALLRTMVTSIRPVRYASGTLKLTTTVPTRVSVDGKELIKHTSSDSTAAEEKTHLSLQPQVLSRIQVDFLSSPDDKTQPRIGLEFVPDEKSGGIDILTGADVARRFSIETTTLGPRTSNAEISPDGKYVMLVTSTTDDGKSYRKRTDIQDLNTGRTVWSTASDVAWMPRGSKLYYTEQSLLGSGFDVFAIDPMNPAPVPVAQSLPTDRFYWAPDSSFIIYYDEQKGETEKGPLLRTVDPDDRQPGMRDASYLVKYDIKEGISTPLTYGGPSTYMTSISPDSKKLVYLSTRRTPDRFPFYESSLVELDLKTLATDTIAKDEDGLTSAVYSPDSKQLFICGGPESFGGIGRNAGNFEYANQFDIQGFIYDIPSRKVTAVTRNFNPAVEGTPIWNRADGKVYFRAEEGFYSNTYAYDPGKETFTKLETGIDYARTMSVGEDESRWMAVTGMGYSYAGRAVLLDLKSGKTRMLAAPYDAEMATLDLGTESPWQFISRDGSVIDGMMVLPPDFDVRRKYPLIVYYYGGTSPSGRTMSNPYTPHLFASRDYVVYVLNPSGTTGYGQEFSARHVNAWGDWTADEIIEGVQKFCDAHPFVERTKIGCLGASYGGFMTQYLLTKTDMFAAAASHAGISNVTSYWGEGYWGYSYNAVAAAKSYPWTDPELFTKHGSLFNADKIHTPLLLLHGNADTNVPIGESIQLFNALKILGRDVEFITVDGENHIITDYEKRKLWHATIMAWFAKYLQDDPAWWDSMYK